jgi:hypothetical protein
MNWREEDRHGCTDLPYSFEPTSRDAILQIVDICEWCVEQFGDPRTTPDRRGQWYLFDHRFHFRNLEDAIHFRFRWG